MNVVALLLSTLLVGLIVAWSFRSGWWCALFAHDPVSAGPVQLGGVRMITTLCRRCGERHRHAYVHDRALAAEWFGSVENAERFCRTLSG